MFHYFLRFQNFGCLFKSIGHWANCILLKKKDALKEHLVIKGRNRFKCQSSLLGLQTEIIEAYFFNNSSNEKISLMIPYVIKNC